MQIRRPDQLEVSDVLTINLGKRTEAPGIECAPKAQPVFRIRIQQNIIVYWNIRLILSSDRKR